MELCSLQIRVQSFDALVALVLVRVWFQSMLYLYIIRLGLRHGSRPPNSSSARSCVSGLRGV